MELADLEAVWNIFFSLERNVQDLHVWCRHFDTVEVNFRFLCVELDSGVMEKSLIFFSCQVRANRSFLARCEPTGCRKTTAISSSRGMTNKHLIEESGQLKTLKIDFLRNCESSHEIMVLFVFRKLILQRRMRSYPVGLYVWFLVGPFVYFHTSCVRTAKALARLPGCAGLHVPSLVAYVW